MHTYAELDEHSHLDTMLHLRPWCKPYVFQVLSAIIARELRTAPIEYSTWRRR